MKPFLWSIIGAVARLGALIAAKAVLVLLVVVVSVTFSVASFSIPALGSAIWTVAEFITRMPPAVASPEERQRLRNENRALQGSNQNLTENNRRIANRNQDLARQNEALTERNRRLQREKHRAAQAARVQKVDSRRLTADNRRLIGRNAELRSQIVGTRAAAAKGARRVGRRAVQTTTRSVSAIPIESIPILGVSTIIATTAWEIRDACRTLDDMAEIQRVLGGEPDTGFAERACDMAPLRRERGDHYGNMTISACRAEADEARDRIFELASQARSDVPDLVAGTEDFDDEVREAADEEYEAINRICDCIAELDCDPVELDAR